MDTPTTGARASASPDPTRPGTLQLDQAMAHDPLSEDWVIRVAGGGEVLFVTDIAVPDTAPAGSIMDLTVDVQNAAISVAPDDPDSCSLGVLRSGYEYQITVSPSWNEPDFVETKCLKTRSSFQHTPTLNAPEESGTYTVTITVEGTGSGFSASGDFEIGVTSDGGSDGGSGDGDDVRVDPGPGEDQDSGSEGGGTGPDFGFGGFGVGAAVGGIGILFVLVFLLSQSG